MMFDRMAHALGEYMPVAEVAKLDALDRLRTAQADVKAGRAL
jgi:hypothetical protein